MISNGNDQSGLIIIGAYVSSHFNVSNAWMHSSEKLNGASLTRSLVIGHATCEKSFMNLLLKLACPRKLRMAFTFVGYASSPVFKAVVERTTKYGEVIHEYFHAIFDELMEYCCHAALKSGGGIA
ncbi:hypothetical protein Tco_1158291 [Tanacetum coccineum]